MNKSVPEVRYVPTVSEDLVLVSVPDLAKVFFHGIDNFLIDLFTSPEKAKVAEKRLHNFIQELPYEKK
jgi:hypothetical protein